MAWRPAAAIACACFGVGVVGQGDLHRPKIYQWVKATPMQPFPDMNATRVPIAAPCSEDTLISTVAVRVTENCSPARDTLVSARGVLDPGGCEYTLSGGRTLADALDFLRDMRYVMTDTVEVGRTLQYTITPSEAMHATCLGVPPSGDARFMELTKEYERIVPDTDWMNDDTGVLVFPDLDCNHFPFESDCNCSMTVSKAHVFISSGYEVSDNLTSNAGTARVTYRQAPESFLEIVIRQSLSDTLAELRTVRFRTVGNLQERVIEFYIYPTNIEEASGYLGSELETELFIPTYQYGGHVIVYNRVYFPTGELVDNRCHAPEFEWFGLIGYIAAMESKEEIETYFSRNTWDRVMIGLTDIGEEGVYRWFTGPETPCAPYDTTAGDYRRSACYLGPTVGHTGSCDSATYPQCTQGRVLDTDLDTSAIFDTLLMLLSYRAPTDNNYDFVIIDHRYDQAFYAPDPVRLTYQLLCEYGGVGRSCLGANPFGKTIFRAHRLQHELSHGEWFPHVDYPLVPYMSCAHFSFTPPCACDTTQVGRVTVTVVEGCDAANDVLTSAAGTVSSCKLDVTTTQTLEDAIVVLQNVTFRTAGTTDTARVVEYMLYPAGAEAFEVVATYKGHMHARLPEAGDWKTSAVDALNECASWEWFGLVGYLSALETADEVSAVRGRVGAASLWVGGADVGAEGAFKWFTGPEACAPYTAPTGYARSGCDLGVDDMYVGTGDCDSATYPQCTEGTAFDSGFPWVGGAPADAGGEDFVVLGADGGTAVTVTVGAPGYAVLCEWGGVGKSCIGADAHGRTTFVSQKIERYQRVYDEWATETVYTPFEDLTCAYFKFEGECSCNATEVGLVTVQMVEGCEKDEFLLTNGTYLGCWARIEIQGRKSIEDALADLRTVQVRMLVNTTTGYNMHRVMQWAIHPVSVVEFATHRGGAYGFLNVIGDHVYGYFYYPLATVNFEGAADICSSNRLAYFGLIGYLTALTTPEELLISVDAFRPGPQESWLGLSDRGHDARHGGVWKWITGPGSCAPHALALYGYARSGCFLGTRRGSPYRWSDRGRPQCDTLRFPQCAEGIPITTADGTPFTAGDDMNDWPYWYPLGAQAVRASEAAVIGRNARYSGHKTKISTEPSMGKAASVECEWGGVGRSCLGANPFGNATFVQTPRRLELSHGEWFPHVDYPLVPYMSCAHFSFTPPCACDTTQVGRVTVTVVEGCDAANDVLTSAAGTVSSCKLDVTTTQTLEDAIVVLQNVTFRTAGTTDTARVVEYMLYPAGAEAFEVVATYKGHMHARLPEAGDWKTSAVDALNECASWEWFGLVGYLSALETADEVSAVRGRVGAASLWVGGADVGAEGAFKWFTGPEACAPYTAPTGYARSGCDLGVDDMYVGTGDCDSATYPQCTEGTAFDSGFPWVGGAPADAGGEDFVVLGADGGTAVTVTVGAPGYAVLCEWGGVGKSCIGADAHGRTTFLAQANVTLDRTNVTSWTVGEENLIFLHMTCEYMKIKAPCSCDGTKVRRLYMLMAPCDWRAGDRLLNPIASYAGCYLQVLDENMTMREALRIMRGIRFWTESALESRVIEYVLAPGIAHMEAQIRWWNSIWEYNGHVYVVFPYELRRWFDASHSLGRLSNYGKAELCAFRANEWYGLVGYLAAIETKDEEEAALTRFYDDPYDFILLVGMTDYGEEGVWKWYTGPQACGPYQVSIGGYLRSACYIGIDYANLNRANDRARKCDRVRAPQCASGLPLYSDALWMKNQPDDTGYGQDVAVWYFGTPQAEYGYQDHTTDFPQTTNGRTLCEYGGIGESCLGRSAIGQLTLTGRTPVDVIQDDCRCGRK